SSVCTMPWSQAASVDSSFWTISWAGFHFPIASRSSASISRSLIASSGPPFDGRRQSGILRVAVACRASSLRAPCSTFYSLRAKTVSPSSSMTSLKSPCAFRLSAVEGLRVGAPWAPSGPGRRFVGAHGYRLRAERWLLQEHPHPRSSDARDATGVLGREGEDGRLSSGLRDRSGVAVDRSPSRRARGRGSHIHLRHDRAVPVGLSDQ